MLETAYLVSYIASFVLVLLALAIINPIAIEKDLVDKPDGDRKQNVTAVPLTGGMAIFAALAITLAFSPIAQEAVPYPLDFFPLTGTLLALLILAHVLDDVYDIAAVVRLTLDGLIGILISSIGLLQITTLGYLFGPSEMTLGRWSILMTIFSFIAASNAFNMTDGIDGLCVGLGIICFATILALLLETRNPDAVGVARFCMVMICALLAMYIANLGYLGKRFRAFLGDSGARLIGFIAAITLMYIAKEGFVDPVIVYFPIAVPVCDCLILMGSRALQKRSPLSADRLHMHHLLLDFGLSQNLARAAIFLLALSLSALGYLLQNMDVVEWQISITIVASFFSVMAIRQFLIRMNASRGVDAVPVE